MPRPNRNPHRYPPGPPPGPAAPPGPWGSIACGVIALATYLAWAPRASGLHDSGEFTLVLATRGLAHPTGYPLYTLIGHEFVSALHALGAGWSFAANAFSALAGAVAVAFVHALAARLLAREGVRAPSAALVALLPAAAFAVNPLWTAEATLAEVNAAHVAWALGASLLLEGTLDACGSRRNDRAWRTRCACLWGIVAGTGLSHHVTSILFLLPYTVALLAAFGAPRARLALTGGLAALVPLASLGYVAHRAAHPALVQWPTLAPGVRGIFEHVTGAGYQHYLGHFAAGVGDAAALGRDGAPWVAAGLFAAITFALRPARGARATRIAFACAVVAQVSWTLLYGVADPGAYLLPAIALGLAIAPAAVAAAPAVRRLARPLAIGAAAGLLVFGAYGAREAIVRKDRVETTDAFLFEMWSKIPVERGYVLWNDDASSHLREYQILRGVHPGLVVVESVLLLDPHARAAFPALGELESPAEEAPGALEDRVASRLNAGTADPVILFRPAEPSLRVLDKPGTGGAHGPE